MAKVGLEYVCSAKLTEAEETGAATYAAKRYWGPSSTVGATPNTNQVQDYGDDRVVESENTLTSIALSIELNEPTLELEAELLGHEYDSETNEIIEGSDDVAPFEGIGFVGKSKRNGKMIFRAIFYPKVQVSQPDEEYSTKTDTTTFNHSTFAGNAYALGNTKHTIRRKAEFDNLAAAKAWVDNLFTTGIPA